MCLLLQFSPSSKQARASDLSLIPTTAPNLTPSLVATARASPSHGRRTGRALPWGFGQWQTSWTTKRYYHLAYPWRDVIAKYKTFALESKTDTQKEISFHSGRKTKLNANIITPRPELRGGKKGEISFNKPNDLFAVLNPLLIKVFFLFLPLASMLPFIVQNSVRPYPLTTSLPSPHQADSNSPDFHVRNRDGQKNDDLTNKQRVKKGLSSQRRCGGALMASRWQAGRECECLLREQRERRAIRSRRAEKMSVLLRSMSPRKWSDMLESRTTYVFSSVPVCTAWFLQAQVLGLYSSRLSSCKKKRTSLWTQINSVGPTQMKNAPILFFLRLLYLPACLKKIRNRRESIILKLQEHISKVTGCIRN